MATEQPLPFDPIAEARRQWTVNDWGEPAAMAAATSIMRAQQLVLRRVDSALAPFGLTFARYEVLALLALSRRGELPMGKIGVRLMVHPASVTNAVDRLAAAGLVLVARATKVLAAIRFGMEDLPDGECDRLTDAVTALRTGVDFDSR